MERGFPTPPETDAITVQLHVAMLVLVVVALAGLIFRSGRRARPLDLWVWAGLIILAWAFTGAAHGPLYYLWPPRWMTRGMLAVWLVSLAAFLRTAVAMMRLGRRDAALWFSGATIAPLFLTCTFFLLETSVSPSYTSYYSPCRNNLKQFGLAFHNWHDEHGRLPDMDCSEQENPPLSWRVALLPYADRLRLHEQYDQSEAWDAAANLEVARTEPDWPLSCRAVPEEFSRDQRSRFLTPYVMVTGPQTICPQGRGITLDEITDGLSQTFLATEAVGLNIVWTQPRDFDVATQLLGVNLRGDRPGHSPGLLSSYHLRGAQAMFADGSVRMISGEIDPQVLKALTTASGGEEIDGWDD